MSGVDVAAYKSFMTTSHLIQIKLGYTDIYFMFRGRCEIFYLQVKLRVTVNCQCLCVGEDVIYQQSSCGIVTKLSNPARFLSLSIFKTFRGVRGSDCSRCDVGGQ